jgi:hypothetical protein
MEVSKSEAGKASLKCKVFSATKSADRQSLGEVITTWLSTNGNGDNIEEKHVLLSSDSEYHCLTIVFFYR